MHLCNNETCSRLSGLGRPDADGIMGWRSNKKVNQHTSRLVSAFPSFSASLLVGLDF